MEFNTLPKGWVVAKLDDLCEIIMGQSPPSVTYNTLGVGLPFFQGKKGFTKLHPKVENWCSQPNKIAESDDVLISIRAPVGDTNIANQKCCIGRGLAAIRYCYDNKYILYYLKLIKEQLNEKGTGTTFKAISGDLLKQTTIPLAPLPEQKRILAKLEQLLTDLDKGIEYLKTSKQQLKVYRQAVLKWAFEGKLTNCINITHSKVQLNTICNIIGGVTKGRKLEGKSTVFVPYLRVANVQDGYLDLSVIKEIEVLPGDIEKYKLIEGDILYTEGGDRDKLGRGTIWRDEIKGCIHQNHIFRARPKSENFNSKYVAYYSQTKQARDYFISKGKQTTNLASINLTVLSNFPIPIPSKIEQDKIVQEIESRLSVCDRIEETIESSLLQAEALRLSIIKKAFEGKLVPQDPNDEPAEKLLERIRAAKAVISKSIKTRSHKVTP